MTVGEAQPILCQAIEAHLKTGGKLLTGTFGVRPEIGRYRRHPQHAGVCALGAYLFDRRVSGLPMPLHLCEMLGITMGDLCAFYKAWDGMEVSEALQASDWYLLGDRLRRSYLVNGAVATAPDFGPEGA